MGMSLANVFVGAVITESVFSWPGMGSLAMSSIRNLDYPVILGITLFAATAIIVGNLLADILYGVMDPRIRYACK
jgi:peptide/nickel transport system permease protein